MTETVADLLHRYRHLTTEQLQELYRCRVDGILPPATMPRERLAALYEEARKTPRQKLQERLDREQRARFMEWFKTLDTQTMNTVCQKLATGTPSAQLMQEFK